MKFRLSILLLLFSYIVGYSQVKPAGIIQIMDVPVLYVNSEYKISAYAIGYDSTILEGENIMITKDEGSNYTYTIKTSNSRSCKIYIRGIDSTGRKATIGMYNYLLISKPEPQIFIDQTPSGNFINSSISKFKFGYSIESRVRASFSILSWKVVCEKETFIGEGPAISDELKKKINSCKSESSVIVKLEIKDEKTTEVNMRTAVFLIE